jgi:DNA-binding PadR family transcriptional regulator
MPRPPSRRPVKMRLLILLEKGGPKRYSELVRELKKPDKTVYTTLKALVTLKLAAKAEDGKYVTTDKGKEELKRMMLVSAVEGEDDPRIISGLADLHRMLTREKKRKVGERWITRTARATRCWPVSSPACL